MLEIVCEALAFHMVRVKVRDTPRMWVGDSQIALYIAMASTRVGRRARGRASARVGARLGINNSLTGLGEDTSLDMHLDMQDGLWLRIEMIDNRYEPRHAPS